MSKIVLIVTAVLALMATGCQASQDAGSDKPPSAPSTHAVAKPEKPVVWTVDEAGKQYLALVKPGNRMIDHLNRLNRRNDQKRPRLQAGLPPDGGQL